MRPLRVVTVCFWLVLQVDAEDAHAVGVDVFADGDEADGDIRLSGIKTG